MKKLLAHIIEENIQFAQKLNVALQRTNIYETRVFASSSSYQNYVGNRPDLLVMDNEVKYAAPKLEKEDFGKSPAILVLKDKEFMSPLTAYEYVLKDEFAVEKIEKIAGGYANVAKLKEENQALTKIIKMEKNLIVWTAAVIIGLYYSTFLLQ